jgi:hypothetical protein
MRLGAEVRRLFAASLGLSLSMVVAASRAEAAPISIDANEVLSIHFSLSSVPSGAQDIFLAQLTSFTATGGAAATFKLFDGTTLLGTHPDAFGFLEGVFISSTSQFLPPATVVDFSSFHDGSIDGLVEVTISTGTLSGDTDDIDLIWGHVANDQVGIQRILDGSDPVISQVSTGLIPEPSATVVFAAGCVLVGWATRKHLRY